MANSEWKVTGSSLMGRARSGRGLPSTHVRSGVTRLVGIAEAIKSMDHRHLAPGCGLPPYSPFAIRYSLFAPFEELRMSNPCGTWVETFPGNLRWTNATQIVKG